MHKISTTTTVAIKLISSTTNDLGEKGFIAEVQMLSKCKHPNIVSLIGFCDEGPQKILIYEYVPNGSLDGYLERSYRMTSLTWGRRIQICLDIACGLDYLHSGLNGNEIIIHRDIKSANILLDDNFRAKIADFGLSRLNIINSKNSTINTVNLAGTEFNDKSYNTVNEKGLPSLARRLFREGKSKEIVDPSIKDTDGSVFSQSRVADQHSLDTFLDIANQCLAETQDERPTIKEVIEELEKALNFQKNNPGNLQVLLEDINVATQSFSDYNCIGEGKYWKLYKGEVLQAMSNAKGCTAVVAKRWNKSGQGNQLFSRELEFVFKNKHENVTNLVGYCTEMEENIIVYEHSSKGSLDMHLKDISLTWMERLKICIDVARGLEFLHSCGGPEETVMMHGDIKSGSILIDGDRKAKVSNLELILLEQSNLEWSPLTVTFRQNTESDDISRLGELLLEVLSGRLTSEDPSKLLVPLPMKWNVTAHELDEVVFEGIKDQIDPFSLIAFTRAVGLCFQKIKSIGSLVKQIEEALEYQAHFISHIAEISLKKNIVV
uniref:receptor-like protein kinase HERK 1 n=1 Tax=Erigeron canadensis TaxID=72917 RepID=UPI001CB91142|nr:receptor-like protein kinase HERK 1 [Erigeron canadensis]